MTQEILRTEDIVEILDVKIHTSEDHPDLSVLEDDVYDDVLDNIELQICSPDQKAAFTTALSAASTANPVVLKEDIETYYPSDDLGEFKDAVDTLVDLLALAGPHTLNDMRPVLAEGGIYRWDGGAWVEFINTGTIDHTMLINFDADPNYQHLSLILKSSLLGQIHTHTNAAVLDAINTVGSGIIIATEERERIPSQDEKDALVGTVGTPSATNRYVTNVDPRLNTIKNPYYTFGPLGSGASFMGSDINDLEQAANAVLANPYVGALEILPYVYPLNAGVNSQGFAWLSSDSFILEALALKESVLEFSPEPAGTTAFYVATGAGQVHIRGLVLDISGVSILASLIARDNTIFEDCVFTSSDVFVNGCKGVDITGNNCSLLRCTFSGTLNKGVEITGHNCRVQDCSFEMSNVVDAAIISADGCIFTGNTFINANITVTAGISDTIFDNNRIINSTFTDAGLNTRWTGSRPQDHQQAYVGRTRTLGSPESYADFRGTTEAAFIAALADPYTKRIEILDSSFTFSSPVTIPDGCTLIGIGTTYVSGGHCFTLSKDVRLYHMNMTFSNGDSGIKGTAVDEVEIKECTIDITGPDIPSNYAISITDSSNIRICGTSFSGTRGISLQNVSGAKIRYNSFNNTAMSIVTDANTTNLHFGDNTYCQICSFAGERALIRGNIFTATVPTKINLVDSHWVGNYPIEVNNEDGVTKLVLSPKVKPVVRTGCALSSFLGTASILFLETGTPTAVTAQYQLSSKIDRSKGFTLTLCWTAAVFSGDVRWEVTTVFRDRLGQELGSPTLKEVTSPKTTFNIRQEEKVDIVFADTDYGFIGGVDPTHMAIKIRRLGDSGLDTLPGQVFLTETVLTLYRD